MSNFVNECRVYNKGNECTVLNVKNKCVQCGKLETYNKSGICNM